MIAQQFDTGALKLEGEPHTVADPVSMIALLGQMNASVSAGGLLVYSATNPLSQFMWLDRSGRTLGAVGEPGPYDTFRLSPDGRRIAAPLDRPGSNDLWLLEVERGMASRFTFQSGQFPIWSPDGRTILYSAGSPLNLFRKAASGTGSEQRLTHSPYTQLATVGRATGNGFCTTRSLRKPNGTSGLFPWRPTVNRFRARPRGPTCGRRTMKDGAVSHPKLRRDG